MAGWGSVLQSGGGSGAGVRSTPDIWGKARARWGSAGQVGGNKPGAVAPQGDSMAFAAYPTKPGNVGGTQPGAAAPQVAPQSVASAAPTASGAPVVSTPLTVATPAPLPTSAAVIPGQTPAQSAPSMNDARMNALSALMTSPESLSPEVQAGIMQSIRNSRDMALQDEQRRIAGAGGAAGIGDSGLVADQAFRAGLARDSDLANAESTLRSTAASTNFKDRQDVASLLFGQQTGQQQAMQSLADQIFNTGVNSQTQQSNLLSQLGSLVGAGTSYNQNQLQTIWNQLLTRYQNPDVSSGSMVPSQSNDWLAAMSGGNGGGGGGGNDWMGTAQQGVETAAQIAALIAL